MFLISMAMIGLPFRYPQRSMVDGGPLPLLGVNKTDEHSLYTIVEMTGFLPSSQLLDMPQSLRCETAGVVLTRGPHNPHRKGR